jgi:diguanylate cyclase (GGDEF)-like protein
MGIKGARSPLLRKELLTFIPAVGLASLWYGWQGAALVLASAIAVAWMASPPTPSALIAMTDGPRDSVTGLHSRAYGERILDVNLRDAVETGRTSACLVVGLDDSKHILRSIGENALNDILNTLKDRLAGALRGVDTVIRLDGAKFGILLVPTQRTDLESLIQLSARLQSILEQPMAMASQTHYISCHIGFCLSTRAPETTGASLLLAAEIAAKEAENNGPSAIRAFSTELQATEKARAELSRDIAAALEDGQIVAYFQPQLSSDTGDISGFQAVPRWLHPMRGVLAEAELIPVIDAAGLRERLNEVMLYNTFSALRGWDKRHLRIPNASIALSVSLLANPKMAERLRWEIDRFEMTPDRIRLILPQSVIPQIEHDIVARNLATLAAIGFEIELDGFGVSAATINSIRQSRATRLRIHRSFTSHVDTDQTQQKLVSAIISLAEGLGLDTLGEGVQAIGEHSILTQLGCSHVQGAAISRPMGYEDTLDWIERHRAKLKSAPRIGRGKK